jgi:hypothetical protein
MRKIFGNGLVASGLVLVGIAQVGFGHAARAADVTQVQGRIEISRSGGPFRPVTGPTVCNTGDVVRAVQEGSAQIVGAGNVVQTATPGNPVNCSGQPAAATQSAAAQGAPGPSGAAGGAGAAASGATAAVIGGVVVVAGVVGAVALAKKSSSSP